MMEIRHLFTYGTLRDDDDSGAPWTAGFIQGAHGRHARVRGFRLVMDPVEESTPLSQYCYASRSDDPEDFVQGRLLSFETDEIFRDKLAAADRIEGFDENDDESEQWYLRLAVEAELTDDAHHARVPAYMYYRKHVMTPLHRVIPGGDWRNRAAAAPLASPHGAEDLDR